MLPQAGPKTVLLGFSVPLPAKLLIDSTMAGTQAARRCRKETEGRL